MDTARLFLALAYVLPVLNKQDNHARVCLHRNMIFAIGTDQTNIAVVPGAWFPLTAWSHTSACFLRDLFETMSKHHTVMPRVDVAGLTVTLHVQGSRWEYELDPPLDRDVPPLPTLPWSSALASPAGMRASRKQLRNASAFRGSLDPDVEWYAVPNGPAWATISCAGETLAVSIIPRGGRAKADRLQMVIPGTDFTRAGARSEGRPENDNAAPTRPATAAPIASKSEGAPEKTEVPKKRIPDGVTPEVLYVLRLAKELDVARGKLHAADARGASNDAEGKALAAAEAAFWSGWEVLEKAARAIVSNITSDAELLDLVLAQSDNPPTASAG